MSRKSGYPTKRSLGSIQPFRGPDYGPDYVILHGMDAMIAVTGGNAPAMEKALVPGFDAQAAWAKIPQAYLHCS